MAASELDLIRRNKQFLGPITVLDFSASDAPAAHYSLGADARAQIHKILARRLDSAEDIVQKIRLARSSSAALAARLQNSSVSAIVKAAIRQYQACLSAWAAGALLAEFRHPLLPAVLDGMPVHAHELALLLQEDEVGCQTGVYRESSGAVILWHSEEDHEEIPGQRFDRLRLFCFPGVGGRKTSGFIYPDLLPGPTFGWQAADYAQAVDTLHVRPIPPGAAILPNTLAWLSLYLGGQVALGQLAEMLAPFQGGYSLTTVCKNDDLVGVEKVEFANQQVATESLSNTSGSYLFQTNILNDLSLPISVEELTSSENRAWNQARITRTARLLRSRQNPAEPLPLIFHLLRSRQGGDAAYANRDVKAYFVCRMAPAGTSVWVGSGAALRSDQIFHLE